MSGLLIGTVVTRAEVTLYAARTSFSYPPTRRIGPVQVQGTNVDPRALLSHLERIRQYNGQDWHCPAMDGGRVLVEGVQNGERFAFSVDNPTVCSDRRSADVVDIMRLAPAFDYNRAG